MTSRLDRSFDELRRRGKKALVVYLCVGDPTLEESIDLAVAAADAGADVLELGVPFSDPTADGPVIARAAQRAIRSGATLSKVLDAAARVRARTNVPLVLFSYYNPVFVMGEASVIERAAEAGIDALLVVDLPPEEGAPLRAAAAAAGLASIPLLAPTTPEVRADEILGLVGVHTAAPRGFVYYVSMTGVTGAGATALAAAREKAEALRPKFGRPVVIGFGIDGASSAREAAGEIGRGADGIVVGTAIVRRIEEASSQAPRIVNVRSFVGELRAALDGAPGRS